MNLRDRARALLQGLTPSSSPQVQSYNVICPEGHRLRGNRTDGYQALRCPTCGAGIFVLPRSPLPEPPIPTPDSRPRKTVDRAPIDRDPDPIALTDPVMVQEAPEDPVADADLDGEIIWEDEQPSVTAVTGEPADPQPVDVDPDPLTPAPAPGRDVGPGTTTRKRRRVVDGAPGQRPASVRQQDRPAPRSEPVRPVAVIPLRVHLADWVRRRRNPLLFLAVGLLIVATVGFRQWRQRRQDLPRVAALGRVEGLAALDEGKFDKAHQLLSDARRAVDSLGDAVEGAAAIRQGAAEASIFISLVPQRLESILDEAGRYDPQEWPSSFKTFYAGRSIVIDSHVTAIPDASGHGSYELDYEILPDGEGKPLRVGRIDFTGFRLFQNTQPKVGDRVQFGARLASFTYDDRAEEWRVGLEPDSGVFLTHPRALEALGWPSIADLAAEDGSEP